MAYASSTLTSAQENSPQIKKEALAISYGCKKSHHCHYGRPLVTETDHRSLEAISQKPLGQAPPHLQRPLFDIQPYASSIIYKKGKDLITADLLSCDCRPKDTAGDWAEDMEVLNVVPTSPSTLPRIQEVAKIGRITKGYAPSKQGWMDGQTTAKWRKVRSRFHQCMMNSLSMKTYCLGATESLYQRHGAKELSNKFTTDTSQAV